jgi:hypothetical protein
MIKPASLRAHLTASTPELKTNPEKLTVFVKAGRLACAGGHSISYEYRYTLSVVVLDYNSHPDAIMVPLLAWVKRHQVELFENTELRDKSIRFEVEYLNAETLDLSIEIDLTERVIVQEGTDPASPLTARRYNVTHAPEPEHVGTVTEPQQWEVTAGGEVLASWSFPASPDAQWPTN